MEIKEEYLSAAHYEALAHPGEALTLCLLGYIGWLLQQAEAGESHTWAATSSSILYAPLILSKGLQ